MTHAPRTLITVILLTSALVAHAVAHADATAPRARRSVEIEWDAIPGASAYEIRVTRKDGTGAPLTFKLKSARWAANVRPGPYVMELRAFDARGVPGSWSPPSDIEVKLPAPLPLTPGAAQVIAAEHADAESIDFTWEPVPLARSYRVELTGPGGPQTWTTKSASLAKKLDIAAEYRWRVIAIDERGADGEVTEPQSFTLNGPALATPRPAAPLSRYVDHVAWPRVDHAEHYETTLSVYNRRTRAWDPAPGPARVDDGLYPFDISRPSGRYKLTVVATADRRLPSPRATLTFTTLGGFTDAGRMRDAQLRDSLDKPSTFYAIASLLPSQVAYVSRVSDTNSRVGFDGGGLTARVGLGFQKRTSAWGTFMVADFGRMDIGGATFTSQSAEAHATYRINIGRRGVARFGAGLFQKQLPIVIGSPIDGFTSLGRVSQYGPHAGLTYELPFTERWGLRADLRAYYAMAGSTGAGNVSATMAHQFQLLGTYRFTPRWTLIGGVGERHDEAAWAATPGSMSFARPGDLNQISVDGAYLNVSAEFGF